MKRLHIIYNVLAGLAMMLLATACYEDLGHYDYHDVNMVDVQIPETKVRMPKEEAVVVAVEPVISQTIAAKEENLVYHWMRLMAEKTVGSENVADYEPYSEGKVCNVKVEPYEPSDVGLLLIVEDTKNGTKWYKVGKVSVVKPYNPCWFVLQEQDGKGVLGAIEGTPGSFFTWPDVFGKEFGEPFPLKGKPIALSTRHAYGNSDAASMFGFFGFTANPAMMLVSESDIACYTPSTLSSKWTTESILYGPTLQGTPIKITQYKMGVAGEWLINDGKNYFSHMDGFCMPYSLRLDDNEVNITAYGSSHSWAYFYDAGNHRFLRRNVLSTGDFMSGTPRSTMSMRKYGSTWNDHPVSLQTIDSEGEIPNKFDPNAIDADLVMRDIVSGGAYGEFVYGVASVGNTNQLSIFRFSDHEGEAECAAVYNVTLPSEVKIEQARFAASYAYSNYASSG
ncbi:PKD-like family lipoprotein [Prevotella sp. KH2C16]|uniref:PKD-like family lipoprotein n=1 Tax=Prevotella sp. KH2C16 TaxID=1855325 RepID=UPI0008E6606B|nr:PKD-like family lipoprotein [Prevotella sp. KH2C16]SFG76897.1 PKD-like family protein [Prevotella sp. KH2C16]